MYDLETSFITKSIKFMYRNQVRERLKKQNKKDKYPD